jgi:hypothetical protein
MSKVHGGDTAKGKQPSVEIENSSRAVNRQSTALRNKENEREASAHVESCYPIVDEGIQAVIALELAHVFLGHEESPSADARRQAEDDERQADDLVQRWGFDLTSLTRNRPT